MRPLTAGTSSTAVCRLVATHFAATAGSHVLHGRASGRVSAGSAGLLIFKAKTGRRNCGGMIRGRPRGRGGRCVGGRGREDGEGAHLSRLGSTLRAVPTGTPRICGWGAVRAPERMWGSGPPRTNALLAGRIGHDVLVISTAEICQHYLVARPQQCVRGVGGPQQQAPHTHDPSPSAHIERGRWRAAHPHRRSRHDSAGRGELQDALQRQRQAPVRRPAETAGSQAGGCRVATLMACCSKQLRAAEEQQPQRQRRRRRLTL